MNSKMTRTRRASRTRAKIAAGNAVRLTVFRSNCHIYAQVISSDGSRILASASTAENLHAMLSPQQRAMVRKCRRLSIGPITSAALCKLGWEPTLEASSHDISGMVKALVGARSATGE